MNLFALLAAFGGGIFGASIGALPAFIMTGVVATIGGIIGMAGGDAGAAINGIAFGSFFGPHVAFAGGVAASAFARKKGLVGGGDITTALAGLNDASVLLVGGIFGIIGYVICTLQGFLFGPIIPGTDGPGITVFISGIIARLVFGERGLLSDVPERKFLSSGAGLAKLLTIAVGYSLVVAGVYVTIQTTMPDYAEAVAGIYNIVIFGLAATGLIFAQTGTAYEGWHHIGIISAYAAMLTFGMGAVMCLVLSVVFGVVAALLCDFEGNLINTNVDSHIDGPAFAIFISTFVLNLLFA
jgi:hypothetical protein